MSDVEVRVVASRAVGAVCALALTSLALTSIVGCTLDRTPRESLAHRAQPVAGRIPTRKPVKVTEDQFGPQPTPSYMDGPEQVGGLQCAGVFCPFTPEPIQPCCTAAEDVERGAARAVDRCGLDFSMTSGNTFSTACWQRDQLGVLDDRCPGAETQPGVEEPGCCSGGVCGTMDTRYAIGCHYELDAEARECGEGDIVGDVECDPLGVFGVRTEIDVTWGGRDGGLAALTDDGRDSLVIHLKVAIEGVENDGSVRGRVQPCNVELPPFYSTTLCESYHPQFPVSIWESGALPEIELKGRYQCFNPGCALTLDAQTNLLGIDLPNPEAPWPSPAQTPSLACSAGEGVACFPDHDADGLPGLSIEILTRGMAPPGMGCDGEYLYRGAPLSASPAAIFGGVRRTDHILLGTRVKLGGTGLIADDCNSGVGAGVAEFVQSRAWGCLVQEGTQNFGGAPAGPNEPCEPAEAQFMDENLPIYYVLGIGSTPDSSLSVSDTSPSEGPLFSIKRLGALNEAISCADVRAASYP